MNTATGMYVKIINSFDRMKKKNKGGQTLVEYALILLLIAIVVIVALTVIGQITNNSYCKIGGALSES